MTNKLVHLTSLKRIRVKGGDVFHALKNNEDDFKGFGEASFTSINYNYIKAWKRHSAMTLNLVVPYGNVQFVVIENNDRLFNSYEIGQSSYKRLTIPPGIIFGFKGLSKPYSLVLNLANIPHIKDEVETFPPDNFDLTTFK